MLIKPAWVTAEWFLLSSRGSVAIASAPGGSLSALSLSPFQYGRIHPPPSQQKLLDTMTQFVLWMASFRRVQLVEVTQQRGWWSSDARLITIGMGLHGMVLRCHRKECGQATHSARCWPEETESNIRPHSLGAPMSPFRPAVIVRINTAALTSLVGRRHVARFPTFSRFSLNC